MNNLKQLIKLILLPLIFIYGCQKSKKLTDAQKLEQFFSKKDVNLLVTDSGLGGVSVAADVYERFIDSGVFENVNITFFNAQPHIKSGYNSMETTEQKVQVFENALNAIQENFAPDLILIACNTLSVIYPLTPFSNNTKIPVIGIVETGVNQIQSELEKDSSAMVLIFATKTTIEKNTHKKMLIERGIDENRIITQACPKLAGRIERGTHNQETLGLVDQYVSEALSKTPNENNSIYCSFNCTHYGYISDVFEEKFKSMNRPVDKIIDPNPKMGDFIFTKDNMNRYKKTNVNIKVVSQPKLNDKRIESIGGLIANVSEETALAMKDYTFTPDMFEFESIAPLKKEEN